MIYLYNDADLRKINKEKNVVKYILISLCILLVIFTVIFVCVATYYSHLVFSVIASILNTLISFGIVYLAARLIYLTRLSREYSILMNSKATNKMVEILEVSSYVTTLADKSRCYEVAVNSKEKKIILYLSEIMDKDFIKEGKCTLALANDYIVGYKYED